MVLGNVKTADGGLEIAYHFHYLCHHGVVHVGKYLQSTQEVARTRSLGPNHALYAIGISVQQPPCVRAVDPVDLDALAAGDEAEDVVAVNWIAAAGHPIVETLDVLGAQHQDVVRRFVALPILCRDFLRLGLGVLRRRVAGEDEGLDVVDIHDLLADGAEEGIDARVLVFLHQLAHHAVGKLQLPVLQTALQQFPAFGRFLELCFLELVLDAALGLGRDHPVQPVLGRPLVLAGHDLHHIAGGELFLDGDGLAVDAGSGAARTDAAMDVECEVQH